MNEFKKDMVLTVLRDFIFPLKELLIQADINSRCNIMVALHERNGIHPNGLLINENIFDIQNVEEDYQNATVKLIIRYLCNIDFICLSVNMRNGHKTDSINVQFDSEIYTIPKLRKNFKYGELPSTIDVNSLISDFRRQFFT